MSTSADFAYILSVDVGWPDMTWAAAKEKCQQHGLSFASVLSDDDQTRIRYKLRGFKTARADGIYNAVADPNCDSNGDGQHTVDDWPCGLWIGGSDIDVEGDWRWASGILMSEYNFGGFDAATGQTRGVYPWGATSDGASSDEPNDYPVVINGVVVGEDCARLDLQYSDGLWNDVPCAWLSPFVCEQALDNSTWRGGFTAQSPSPPPISPPPPLPPQIPSPSPPPPVTPPSVPPSPRPPPLLPPNPSPEPGAPPAAPPPPLSPPAPPGGPPGTPPVPASPEPHGPPPPAPYSPEPSPPPPPSPWSPEPAAPPPLTPSPDAPPPPVPASPGPGAPPTPPPLEPPPTGPPPALPTPAAPPPTTPAPPLVPAPERPPPAIPSPCAPPTPPPSVPSPSAPAVPLAPPTPPPSPALPEPSPPPPPLPSPPEPSPPPPPMPAPPDPTAPPPTPPSVPPPTLPGGLWVDAAGTETMIAVGDNDYIRYDLALGLFFVIAATAIALFVVCRYLYLSNALRRVMAPKLRKKESDFNMEDYVTGTHGGAALGEDNDPELTLNPLMVHKLEQAKQAGQRRGRKGEMGSVGKSGGLARLGLRSDKKVEAPKQKSRQEQLDDLVASEEMCAGGAGKLSSVPSGGAITGCGGRSGLHSGASTKGYRRGSDKGAATGNSNRASAGARTAGNGVQSPDSQRSERKRSIELNAELTTVL